MSIISGGVLAQKLLMDQIEIDDFVSIQLPSIEYATTEIKGAGIAGSIDMPLEGLVNAMTIAINLRSVNKNSHLLLTPGERQMELRVAKNENGEAKAVKVFAQAKLKKYDPGKAEIGNQMEGSAEYEIFRYRQVCDGIETMLIDKRNMICKINGIDVFEKIRAVLG